MIELGSFAFLRPWWLLALPAMAIALRVTRQRRASLGDWARVVDPHLLEAMLKRQGAGAEAPNDRGAFLAMALIALALSGPAVERSDMEHFRNLDATLIVLDVSNDMRGARLHEAVAAAQTLLAQGGARQAGLVLYAGDAYLASPTTDDAAALNALLFAVDDRTVPDGGVRPDRALAYARRVLRDAQIIGADVALISAGEGLTPAATREAARLTTEGHTLHTLFVAANGSDEPRRRAGLAALADAGRGLAADAAQPNDIAGKISSRTIAHVAGSVLQSLGWRDYGPLLLIAAAAPLLLRFRRGER